MRILSGAVIVVVAGVALLASGCGEEAYVAEAEVSAERTAEAAPQPAALAGGPETLNEIVPTDPGKPAILSADCFVKNWAVLGPFEFDRVKCTGDQCQDSMEIEFVPDEAGLRPRIGAEVKGKTWKKYKVGYTFNPEFIDLDAFYNQPEHVIAYAAAEIRSPKALSDLGMYFGSDDYLKVWLNGRLIHTYVERRRAAEWDQDFVENVSLKAGTNWLVLKVGEVVGAYGFYVRFVTEKGDAIKIKG